MTLFAYLICLIGVIESQYLKPDYSHPLSYSHSGLPSKYWEDVINKMYNLRPCGIPQPRPSPPSLDFARQWPKRQAPNFEQPVDSSALNVASKQAELQSLLQQLYEAEAAVKMEAGEVARTQEMASEAEQVLEEATNKVKMLSSDLQSAQEAAAAAAIRAHTAQLQLSAHDQLMFNARQRADALSAQMVSLQADLASAQEIFTLSNSSQHLEQQGRLPYYESNAPNNPEFNQNPPYLSLRDINSLYQPKRPTPSLTSSNKNYPLIYQ